MPTVIGIDPGLAGTGVGVVRGAGTAVAGYAYGCIATPRTSTLPERLLTIFNRLSGVLANEGPDLMVVEDIFSLKVYPRSGITLGKVSGVVLLAGCQAGVPVVEVAVREAKQVLTGNGNASKRQLERAVRHVLDVPAVIRPAHAADALGLALIGLYRHVTPEGAVHARAGSGSPEARRQLPPHLRPIG